MKNKTLKKPSKNLVIVFSLSFFIPLIVALIGLIRGGFAPFGPSDVMTQGKCSSTLTYYMEFWKKIHNGDSLSFSMKSGLGYDFSSVISFFLSDPLNFITLLFPLESIFSVVNFLYAFKLGLSGLFFSIFLVYHNIRLDQTISAIDKTLYLSKKESDSSKSKKSFRIGGSTPPTAEQSIFSSTYPAILSFSVAYALSGYMLSYGMNISYLTAIALLPLIILGLEKLMYEGKTVFYIIVLTVSVYCNFYISCITVLFTILYFVISSHKDTSHKLMSFIKLIISYIIVFGLSSPVVLNSINSVFFRKETSLFFPRFGLFNSFFDVVKRQLPTAEPSQLIKYGNGINIYCGVFVFILIFLYIINRAISFSEKIKKLILFVVLMMATYITTPNYLFNFFLETDDKNSVFAYTLVFMILLISYESYKYLSFNKTIHVAISGFLSIVLIACSLFFCVGYDSISIFVIAIEITVVYLLFMLLWKDDNIADHVAHIIFCVLILAEIIFCYSSNIARFSESELSYYNTSEYKFSAIEDYIHISHPSARILVYEANKTDSTPISNAILGYDYVITSAGTTPVDSNLTYIETSNDIDIYSNPDSIHGGIFIDKSIDLWNNSSSSVFTSLNLFAKCITDCEDIFDFTVGQFSSQELKDLEDLSVDYSTYLHNAENRLNYTLEESGDFYTNLSHIIHVGDVTAGKHVFVNYKSTQEDAKSELLGGEFALFNTANYKTFLRNITQNKTENIYDIDIDAPEDGYILIPIENTENLYIAESSSKPKSLTFCGNLVSLIPVNKGTNKITVSYKNSNTFPSVILIVFSLIILSTYLFLTKKEKISLEKTKVFNRTATFLYNNRVYLYTILVTAVLYIITLMMTKCVPFGTKSGIVSDGYAQTYPSYTKLITDLKNSNYAPVDYSTGYFGGGRSAWSWLAFMNPVWLLGFLFPASQSLLAFNFIYFVTFLLAGPSLIFYLTHRPNGKNIEKKELKLVPLALAYNLSSYVFLYLSFSGFIELSIYTPLIILAMENLIYKKKYLPYTLLLAYIMLWGYYMAFLLCEFLFLYFFVSEFKNIKDFFFKGLRFGICSIISAGLVAFSLLPSFGSVQSNNYAASDAVLKPTFSLQNSMLDSLMDMQIMPRVNLVTNLAYRANTYCGILCLIILGVYLTKKNVALSIKIRRLLLFVLLYFSYSNPFMNYALHGFHIQTMVPNRFAIFNIFLLITILTDSITSNEEKVSKTELIAFIASSVIFTSLIILNNINNSIYLSIILTISFIILYLIIYLYGYFKKNNTKKTYLLLTALTLELLISFLYMGNKLNGIEANLKGNDIARIKTLSREYSMKENPLTRTEIIASNLVNSSVLTDTNAISIFTSMLDTSVSGLSKHWNTMCGTNYIQYDSGNPLGNTMLNVRYFITNDFADGNIAPNYMNKIRTIGNIHLYEDPGYVGNGIIFDKSYNLDSYKNIYNNSFEEQNAFTQMFVNEDLYNIVDVETDINNVDESSSYIMMAVEEYSNVTPTRIYISDKITGDVYMDYYGQITYLGYSNGTKQEFYEVNLYNHTDNQNVLYDDTVRLAVLNTECIEKLQKNLSENVLQNLDVNDNYIKGTASVTSEGTIYFSLPYNTSWKAYVDGNEVPIKFFLDGIGIDITTGNHDLELRYEPSVKNYSYFISLAFLLLVIGYIIKLKVEKKKTIV